MRFQIKTMAAMVVAVSCLSACGGDKSGSSIVPPTIPPVLPPPNTAPVLTGVPALSARDGDVYHFTPTGSDADGTDIVSLPAFTLSVSAAPTVTAGDIAAFTTASGTWRVRAEATGAGTDGIAQGYVWTLDENPGWESPMVCNDTATDRTTTFKGVTFFTPSFSCKFAQNAAPVAIDGARIRAAIAAERWMPYRSSRADGWPLYYPYASRNYLERQSEYIYDPSAMNGTSSSANNVGVISGQGGEYTTSRGATDEIDAQLIALALEDEDVSAWTETMYTNALSFAGYPNRVVFKDGMLRDPQKPDAGKQYEYRTGGREVTEEVESHLRYENWGYDNSHHANVGWALWLGTEDPRIGMIVQSHFQFGLSDFPEYLREAFMEGERGNRTGNMSTYQCSFRQTRATYNCLTSMWRARDVANIVRADDKILWGKTRMDAMYAQVEQQAWDYMDQVTQAADDDYKNLGLKILGAPFPASGCAIYRDDMEVETTRMTRSNFMDQQYGGAIAYLMARNNERVGTHIMEQLGKQFVTRLHYLGGSMGVAGRKDIRGSGIAIGPCRLRAGSTTYQEAAPLPFSDGRGWADWARGLNIASRTDRPPMSTTVFDVMAGHTLVQSDFILRAAQQLGEDGYITPVTDVDAAIASVEIARDMSADHSIGFGLWYKHSHDLFTD